VARRLEQGERDAHSLVRFYIKRDATSSATEPSNPMATSVQGVPVVQVPKSKPFEVRALGGSSRSTPLGPELGDSARYTLWDSADGVDIGITGPVQPGSVAEQSRPSRGSQLDSAREGEVIRKPVFAGKRTLAKKRRTLANVITPSSRLKVDSDTGDLTRKRLCRRQQATSDSDSDSDSDGEGGGGAEARAPRKVLSRKRVDTSSRAFTMFSKTPLPTSTSPSVSTTSTSSAQPTRATASRREAPRSRLANLASELVVTYGPPSLNQMTSMLSRGLGIAEEAMSVAVGSTTSMVWRTGGTGGGSGNGTGPAAPDPAVVLEIEMRTSAERAAERASELKTSAEMKTSVGDRAAAAAAAAGGSGHLKTSVEMRTSVERRAAAAGGVAGHMKTSVEMKTSVGDRAGGSGQQRLPL